MFRTRLLLLALLSPVTLWGQAISFDAPRNYAAPGHALALADYNNDGNPDVVSAGGNIVLSPGSGDGTFQNAVQVFAQPGVRAVSAFAGDFNGDANADAAVAFYLNPGIVVVLLGNGNGTFQPAVSYAVGASPLGMIAADFTGDGVLDLVTANSASRDVSLLKGNSNGTFQAAVSSSAGPVPLTLAAGDFNGDSTLDLVVSDFWDETIAILWGNGTGSFQPGPRTPAHGAIHEIAVADFNRDEKQDLVVMVDGTVKGIWLVPGVGNGTFLPASRLYGDAIERALVATDVNGDGKTDVAALVSLGLAVILGNDDGTFAPAEVNPTRGQTIAAGDLNRDSRTDLLVATDWRNFSVRLGTGGGRFETPNALFDAGLYDGYTSVVSADFNGDARPDFAAVHNSNGGGKTLVVALGNGDGSFQPLLEYSTGYGSIPQGNLAISDLNADGHTDIVLGASSIFVFLGYGDGTFFQRAVYPAHNYAWPVVIGDLNGDSIPDLAALNWPYPSDPRGAVEILLGRGDGTFDAPTYRRTDLYQAYGMVMADFNGDQRLDLAVQNLGDPGRYPQFISVLINNGDGTFRANYIPMPSGWALRSLSTRDVNGDARTDLMVGTQHTNGGVGLLLFPGNGDGTFRYLTYYPTDVMNEPETAVLVDLDGDSIRDLVAGGDGVMVMKGAGDGTFQQPRVFGSSAETIAAADFNGDAKTDLVAAAGQWLVLLTNTSR